MNNLKHHCGDFAERPKAIRALIAKVFTLDEIASLEPFFRELSQSLANRVSAQSEFNITKDLSKLIPLQVIGELAEISREYRYEIQNSHER